MNFDRWAARRKYSAQGRSPCTSQPCLRWKTRRAGHCGQLVYWPRNVARRGGHFIYALSTHSLKPTHSIRPDLRSCLLPEAFRLSARVCGQAAARIGQPNRSPARDLVFGCSAAIFASCGFAPPCLHLHALGDVKGQFVKCLTFAALCAISVKFISMIHPKAMLFILFA